ncbi:MAG: hypothetical protein NVS9B10_01990 [Nevskia sp.]
MAIARWAVVGGLAALVAACTTGSNNGAALSRTSPYTVAELPFGVSGNEPELNLGNPDAVLAAALSAASAATSSATGNLNAFDVGDSPPGRGASACSVGSVNEAVAVDSGSGRRTVTLTSSQCFDSRSGGDQNGIAQLSYVRPSAGQAQGTLAFGSSPASFVYALPDTGDSDFKFRQGRGSIAFRGDFSGSPTTSSVSGFSLILGRGPLPAGGAAFTPNRRIELLIGTPGINYAVAFSSAGGTDSVNFSGRLFLAGSGAALVPACTFSARFDVATNTALQIGSSDGIVRGGMLTLSTSAGSATVQFDAGGNAVVNGSSRTPQAYPANVVRSYCGIF